MHDLQERGLLQGAKWAAEHAVALQQVRRACTPFPRAAPDAQHAVAGWRRCAGACAEHARARRRRVRARQSAVRPEGVPACRAHAAGSFSARAERQPRRADRGPVPAAQDASGSKARFLRSYALYLAGEKRKMEEMVEVAGPMVRGAAQCSRACRLCCYLLAGALQRRREPRAAAARGRAGSAV